MIELNVSFSSSLTLTHLMSGNIRTESLFCDDHITIIKLNLIHWILIYGLKCFYFNLDLFCFYYPSVLLNVSSSCFTVCVDERVSL